MSGNSADVARLTTKQKEFERLVRKFEALEVKQASSDNGVSERTLKRLNHAKAIVAKLKKLPQKERKAERTASKLIEWEAKQAEKGPVSKRTQNRLLNVIQALNKASPAVTLAQKALTHAEDHNKNLSAQQKPLLKAAQCFSPLIIGQNEYGYKPKPTGRGSVPPSP
jgi:hypothetical protein